MSQKYPKHKVAVIQLYAKPLSPEDNFARASNFIRSAAAQGCQLAVLPEYHLTNWLPKHPDFRAACSNWKDYLKRYQDLAKQCNICIVPGTIVRPPGDTSDTSDTTRNEGSKSTTHTLPEATEQTKPSDASRPTAPPQTDRDTTHNKSSKSTTHALPEATESTNPTPTSQPTAPPEGNPPDPFQYIAPTGQPPETGYLNTSYFISSDGSILGSYTKKNLWGPTERNYLSSSSRDPHTVIDTPIGKVGLLICWDLAFPEAFRELIAQGAKIIINPMFWTLSDCSDAGLRHNPSAEAVFVDSMATARTFENTCALIVSNVGGRPGKPGKPSVYMGHSQVCVPFVGPVAKLGGISEGMIVADIDMEILEDAEMNYRVRRDLAHEDWHYDYRHRLDQQRDARSKL